MKKLRLQLGELKVESFETTEAIAGGGTVEAHASPRCFTNLTCNAADNTCAEEASCGGWPSCYVSCDTACPVNECG